MKYCDYGCTKEAKFIFKNGKSCCSKHPRYCETVSKKAILSRKKNGPWVSDDTKAKIKQNHAHSPSWSKGLTKETDSRIEEISKKLKGRKKSLMERNAISNSKKGKLPSYMNGMTHEEISKMRSGANNGMYGKTHTENVRAKLAELAKNKWSGENNPWFGKERSGELSPRWMGQKYNRAYRDYTNKVAFHTEQTYTAFKEEINPSNFKRTLAGADENGFQLDHIVPIKIGFLNNIDPKTIAGKQNLRIVSWKENRRKWDSLTEEGRILLENMLRFDIVDKD